MFIWNTITYVQGMTPYVMQQHGGKVAKSRNWGWPCTKEGSDEEGNFRYTDLYVQERNNKAEKSQYVREKALQSIRPR